VSGAPEALKERICAANRQLTVVPCPGDLDGPKPCIRLATFLNSPITGQANGTLLA
jgi:hypothetical protein